MYTIYINNIQVNVNSNLTIFQACQQLNINIPRFCYHENLKIAGNCRMCLVELKNSIKPVVACAMPVSNNMEIYTETPFIQKAREGVLEFLLLNHPLDCPICDQGGECDLQEQTLTFGSDKTRFFEWKRGVEDLNCGPFIKTIMTRCIHCTRCVRFITDFCESDHLGLIGRGNQSKISFYLKKKFYSEFSGNIIDLCPVGALTSKPFAFKNRSWEIQKKYFFDVFDHIGTPLEIQIYKMEIIRVLPKKNQNLNMSWITNKTRFFYDSLKYQRILNPVLNVNNNFQKIQLITAFLILKKKLNQIDSSKISIIFNYLTDIKSFYFFKKFFNCLGINQIRYQQELKTINTDIVNNFFFSFKSLKQMNTCLLIDCNIREELPILNLFFKNKIKLNHLKIYNIGKKVDLTYSYNNLGLTLKTLLEILEGKHEICSNLNTNTVFIFGRNFLNYQQKILTLKHNNLQKKFNFFVNYQDITVLNSNEVGIHKKKLLEIKNQKLLFLYNTQNFLKKKNKNQFIIYFGHHFTNDAQNSTLLIPSMTVFEKNNVFLNFEGTLLKNLQLLKISLKNLNDLFCFQNLILFFKIPLFTHSISFYQIMPYLKLKKIYFISFNNLFFKKNLISLTSHTFYTNKWNHIFENFSKILNSNKTL